MNDWSMNESCKCVTCKGIDRYAKIRYDAKRKEMHQEWIRKQNSRCSVCNGQYLFRKGNKNCDPCELKILKKEIRK